MTETNPASKARTEKGVQATPAGRTCGGQWPGGELTDGRLTGRKLARWGLVGWLVTLMVVLAGCATGTPVREHPTLFLVGDSTMADQPERKFPMQGWGQALPEFLRRGLSLQNRAQSGHSSESFIEEGHWQRVREAVRPGDFVVIGFGHNDQNSDDPDLYAAPWQAYRANLETMVDATLARGGRPILVTSIYRRHFDDSGAPKATLGAYPEVTRAVATERQVPLVDLNARTRTMLLEAGVEGSADLYMQLGPGDHPNFPQGQDDNTHLQAMGARRVAELFVGEIHAQELPLARYLSRP